MRLRWLTSGIIGLLVLNLEVGFRLHCAGVEFVGSGELDALWCLSLNHRSITMMILSATETALMPRDLGFLAFLTALGSDSTT